MTRLSDRPADATLDEAKDLHNRLVATLSEMAALERVVKELGTKHEELLNAPLAGDLDWRLAELDQITSQQAEAVKSLTTARNRAQLLGDALIGPRLQAKAKQIAGLQDQVHEVERRQQALVDERTEHEQAIVQLTNQIVKEADRIAVLVRQATDLEPRMRRLRVYPTSANPYQPVPGVVVKWTSWRATIQNLQAAGVEEADLVIDEADGEIINSPLKD